jgi:pyridoxal phosphate enzyme (YggS family)
VAEIDKPLTAERVRTNLLRVREQIAAAAARAGRDPDKVEVCAAIKYVPADQLDALAEAGIEVVGENRARDLESKVAALGDRFAWDFIGQLQSRKVKQILPHVRILHSLASESALAQLERHAHAARPGLEVLAEVNVAGEASKGGLDPDELELFIARCPLPLTGLMTMPPMTDRAEDSRPHFAALRELAGRHSLPRLSMGTTQDFTVAVEEGATIVRIGTILYA